MLTNLLCTSTSSYSPTIPYNSHGSGKWQLWRLKCKAPLHFPISSFHRLCSNYVTVSNNLPHPVTREPGSFTDTIEPAPPHGRKKSTQNPEPEICFITFPQSSMQFPELATTKTGHSFSSGALEIQVGRGFVHCYRSCRVGRGKNPNKTMCNSETLRIDTQASHKL